MPEKNKFSASNKNNVCMYFINSDINSAKNIWIMRNNLLSLHQTLVTDSPTIFAFFQ